MKKKSRTPRPGDGGMTRRRAGEEISKDALPVEVCGTVDELVSVLGLARSMMSRPETRELLLGLQKDLFLAGAEAATPPDRADELPARIDARKVRELEACCRRLDRQREMPRHFVIPGGTPASAHLDLARAVARRCERRFVSLSRAGGCRNRHLLGWLNRLSDVLWRMARTEEPPDGESK